MVMEVMMHDDVDDDGDDDFQFVGRTFRQGHVFV